MQNLDVLWAPWRISFIKKPKAGKCFLCEAVRNKNADFMVWKGKYTMVVMNIYPYNNGHLMVAPIKHKGNFEDIDKNEILEIYNALKMVLRVLKKILKPHGFNIGINLGKSAGAGLIGHLHIHIVPRWNGDTNFMPVIASTKVIPQSLEQLAHILKKEFLKP